MRVSIWDCPDEWEESRTTKIGSSLKSWSLGYFGSFGKTLWTGGISSGDNLAPYLSLFFRLLRFLWVFWKSVDSNFSDGVEFDNSAGDTTLVVFSISLPTEVKFCFLRSWWRRRASLTRLLLCLPWLSFSRRGCHRFLLASPMGSQGLVSKTEGLNFALPFVKKMIWKKAKRRRGFLMAEDQRLVRSMRRRSDPAPRYIAPCSHPLRPHPLVSHTRQGWVRIVKSVPLPNMRIRSFITTLWCHSEKTKSDVFTFGISSFVAASGRMQSVEFGRFLSGCAHCARDRIDLGGCQA